MNKEELVISKVDELLSKMTLEEKIGQMTQITLEAVSLRKSTRDVDHEIDLVKLRDAISSQFVGSILNIFEVAHSRDYWHYIIRQIQDLASTTPNKIPVIFGIDAIHGASYVLGASLFPQSINMAATFNRSLVRGAARITSEEIIDAHIPWNFNPVLDIGRQPLWPRFWETFGEDVFLLREMGREYIEGGQNELNDTGLNPALCMKHYIGYSYPLNGRDRTPAWIGERTLREYFLPGFREAVKAGVKTVMVSSGEIDGIPTHSDKYLLTDVLRGELGFKGVTVSDWEDIIRLHLRDRVASTPKEAVKMAVMAGVDMSMVPWDFSFSHLLLELVNENEVPVSRIDEAVGRILTLKYELGLFDNPCMESKGIQTSSKKKYEELNYQAAVESIILAENRDKILPLSKDATVLVTGPTADLLSSLNGGWTITWQGNEESLYPEDKLTLLDAVKEKIGEDNVIFYKGTNFNRDYNISRTVEAAEEADVIIACLGEPAYCETAGNIGGLTLFDMQLQLVEELYKTKKPVILVMLQGRPRTIDRIVNKADAVIIGMLPGMEGGRAIADIIFGDAVPSGKLPFTYPRNPGEVSHYDHKPMEVYDLNYVNPQWSFGHGLSYTVFEYTDLKLSSDNIKSGDTLDITVNVTNTGKLKGKEIVLLYITDLYGSVSRPVRQLKGFEKIELAAAETKAVSFNITSDELSFIGRDLKRITEPGEFLVNIGHLSERFYLR